jgi:CRISPR-associated exonuclease Cas4
MVRRRRRVFPCIFSVAGAAVSASEIIVLALAVLSVACWLYFRAQAEQLPLPDGDIIYKDTARIDIHEPLVSDTYELIGKPDYIVRTTDGLVPVEVKSRTCGERGPYEGEVAQLVAYCLLVEEVMGEPVPKGLLQYADREVPVLFTDKRRAKLLGLLGEMRELDRVADVNRNHKNVGKCRSCGYRAGCGEAVQ